MPDIKLACPKCGRNVTMSEYAVVDSVTCAGCGEVFPGPRAQTQTTRAHLKGKPASEGEPETGRLSVKPRETSQAAAAPVPSLAANPVRAEVRREGRGWLTGPRRRSTLREPAMLAGIAMVALGIPLAWYRYGTSIGPEALAFFDENGRALGPVAFLLFQAMAALEAFRDDFFQGILCLLIPFYFVYYLYTRSENYIGRPAFTMFIIAFAPGIYAGSVAYGSTAYYRISSWIAGHEYEAGFDH